MLRYDEDSARGKAFNTAVSVITGGAAVVMYGAKQLAIDGVIGPDQPLTPAVLALDIAQAATAVAATASELVYTIKNEKSRWGVANRVFGALGFGGFFVADALVNNVSALNTGAQIAKGVLLGVTVLCFTSEVIHQLVTAVKGRIIAPRESGFNPPNILDVAPLDQPRVKLPWYSYRPDGIRPKAIYEIFVIATGGAAVFSYLTKQLLIDGVTAPNGPIDPKVLATDIVQSASAFVAMVFVIRGAIKNEPSRLGVANKFVGSVAFFTFMAADTAVNHLPDLETGAQIAKGVSLGVFTLAALSHIVLKFAESCKDGVVLARSGVENEESRRLLQPDLL